MNSASVQIGWLVLDDAEQRRARDYLRQFRDEGTLDELGFAQVRDALADVFFPATNTIMTRTRYLIFLAAIFHRIENERRSGHAAAERLKRLEDELRKILDPTQKDQATRDAMWGVIGVSAKDKLQRYPSSIYWNALKRLGFFRRSEWSLRYYLDHLAAYYDQCRPRQDDDRSTHVLTTGQSGWDPGLAEVLQSSPELSSDDGFLPETNFSLSRAEAIYLKARCTTLLTDGQTTLLAHLLEVKHDAHFSYPWEVPCPPALKRVVDHARAFSALAKGATLQYYDLLIEQQRAAGLQASVASMRQPFAQWWKWTRQLLARWDFEDFTRYFETKVPSRVYGQSFLTDWLKLCREAPDGLALLTNSSARHLVRQREEAVRPTKHRLGQEKYLRQWQPPKSLEIPWYSSPQQLPYLLDYRSSIGVVFVQEIVAGLKRKS